MKKILFLFSACLMVFSAQAQENLNTNKFKQLAQELPTPNSYRNASGAPGNDYWQQRADYVMEIEIDDEKQRLYGQERITYHNNSPDVLKYLWIQLDQNVRALDSDTWQTQESKFSDDMEIEDLFKMTPSFDGGFKIEHVRDDNGGEMSYHINKTMMRLDLAKLFKLICIEVFLCLSTKYQ